MNIQTIVKEEMLEKQGGFTNFDEHDFNYMFNREGKEELVKGFSFHHVKDPFSITDKEAYFEVRTAIEDALSKLSVPFENCQTIIIDLKVIEDYETLDRWGFVYDFMMENASKDSTFMITFSTDDNLPNDASNQISLYVKY